MRHIVGCGAGTVIYRVDQVELVRMAGDDDVTDAEIPTQDIAGQEILPEARSCG